MARPGSWETLTAEEQAAVLADLEATKAERRREKEAARDVLMADPADGTLRRFPPWDPDEAEE